MESNSQNIQGGPGNLDISRRRECAVFMGSKFGTNEAYRDFAIALAKRIVDEGYDLIFGGCGIGLMGQVADTVLENGGRATGVSPVFPRMRDVLHQGLNEYVDVVTLSERKFIMNQRADVYIALPGGPGTLDEIGDVIALAKAGVKRRPCILCNLNGFYEPTRAQLNLMVENGFAAEEELNTVFFSDDLDEIFAFVSEVLARELPSQS